MHRDSTGSHAQDVRTKVAPGHLAFARENAGSRVHDAAAATGDYVAALRDLGFQASGSDINGDYVAIAAARELPVVQRDASRLQMDSDSVDTVLLFELLEHLAGPDLRKRVLVEAKRVARRNVLITTPDSTHLALLEQCGLTYEHMLDRDHSVFYDEEMVRREMGQVFGSYELRHCEEIDRRILGALLPRPVVAAALALRGLRRRRATLFFRYYVVADARS